MIYFAKITKESSKSFLVEFPELEGCYTEGTNIKDAIKNAKEALNGWLASNCDREFNIPEPKKRKSTNHYPIDVDLSISFAIMLRKIRKEKKLSQAFVAKKIGITQQAYAKLESPLKANPSLATIQKISEKLDIEFVFNLAA